VTELRAGNKAATQIGPLLTDLERLARRRRRCSETQQALHESLCMTNQSDQIPGWACIQGSHARASSRCRPSLLGVRPPTGPPIGRTASPSPVMMGIGLRRSRYAVSEHKRGNSNAT
jgi:hypothetical protein